MLSIALIICVAVAGTINSWAMADIDCEKIDRSLANKNCCYLNATTKIISSKVTFAGPRNWNVDAILFDDNMEVRFLPVNIYKKFPHLERISAESAAVTTISAMNFQWLLKVKFLNLKANKIEVVPNDCFEGLLNLIEINLNGNRITKMSGLAFANLPRLSILSLAINTCNNLDFDAGSDLKRFLRKISRNCASADVADRKISCSPFSKCESLKNYGCCIVEPGSRIDSSGYSFVANANYSQLEMLRIVRQRNIEFLPVSVHESFPKLKIYYISDTPVQKISKKNFEKMYELWALYLDNTQIEMIRSDTFEDLVKLESVNIIKQRRLIALNGQAFANLPNLKDLFLFYNYCIHDTFFGDYLKKATAVISSRCAFEEFVTRTVACESYRVFDVYVYCVMNGPTAISVPSAAVDDLRDEEVEGIIFHDNTKIEYLPYKIFEQLPNLISYWAARCSIKQIAKENFEKLNRLKTLDLASNQIEKISGNLFQGLANLQNIDLSGNRIKSINGRTFDQLSSIASVDLSSNKCIDERLDEGQPIKNFTRKIIQNCAFTETGEREFEKVFDIECGVGKGGTGFIIGGNATKPGQWPFMAALLFEPISQFFCGGNVITTSHVLTAAHCIQDKYQERPLEASQILILLGRHNISLRAEVGSEVRGVKEIKVHPRWNSRDIKFEGDIAVLEMDRPVQFSELIQPICLTVEPEISEREAGFVVGWGKSESGAMHENIPRQVLISSVTTEVCFVNDFKIGSIFAQGMYCAGGDGVGPCNGDSGGGFFVRYHGLWALRGIVSSGSSKAEGGCDVGRYSLFTNVLDYVSWIDKASKKIDSLRIVAP